MATLKTNTLTGTSTAGSIAVTGEGNSTTTNLQQGLAKMWMNYKGTATNEVRDSLNVGSVTDNGTGNYTITISNALASTNYASVANGNRGLSIQYTHQAQNNSTTACQVGTYDASTFADIEFVHVTAHGDLA